MKKLLTLVALIAITSTAFGFGRRGSRDCGNDCGFEEKTSCGKCVEHIVEPCPKVCCQKMVPVNVPPVHIKRTTCETYCPQDCAEIKREIATTQEFVE
jgi:hypothetical protein